MKSKSKLELGFGHAGKTKGKKTIKTRILNALKKRKRNIKKFFGRKGNTTSIQGGGTTSNDVVRQAETNIIEVVIPSSVEPFTLDNVATLTPSKDESKLQKNNKRPRDDIESTISNTTDDIASPKTPIQDGEKSKQLGSSSELSDIRTRSGSGSRSWSGSTQSRISAADIHPGICSPVRKRPKMALNGTAESATKGSSDKKRKQRED